MKNTILFLYLLFSINICSAQTDGEFVVYENGLIYNDTTIAQLKYIVDSLNLKFKTCDPYKTYYSKAQAKAHYVHLSSGNFEDAMKYMDEKISFSEFTKIFQDAIVDTTVLVLKYHYKNYNEEDVVEYNGISFQNSYGYEVSFTGEPKRYDQKVSGTWVYNHYNKTDYSKESIVAFYFINEFVATPVAENHARLIQYVDCMIDTSTQIFYDSAKRTGVRYDIKQPSNVSAFLKYIHNKTGYPEYDSDKYEEYNEKYSTWDSIRFQFIDSALVNDIKFKKLLDDAVDEALKKGLTCNEFEEYVGRYYSKKTELDLKRNRIVVGGCSMDNSPRVHAKNIAVLSAETVSWDIFLRAHLDIMNDRFDRVSDGSYAWGARQTYIHELEVLDIDVIDLLIAISLRIENPSDNHYYGSIGRVGRALSETVTPEVAEEKMLTLIRDNTLDDYNRLLIYYLFLNYNYYVKDELHQKENAEKLNAAVKELPLYLSEKIEMEMKEKEEKK